jgi:hypothetical protein
LTTTSVPSSSRAECNLPDRRGRERHRLDRGEDGVDRPAEAVGDRLLDLWPGCRLGLALQPAQLRDQRRRQQVAPGGEGLAELDERDPTVLQRPPQGDRGLLEAGAGAMPARPQEPAEPVPDRDADDRGVAAGPAPPAAPGAQQCERAGHAAGGQDRLEDDQRGQAEGERPGHGEDHEQDGGGLVAGQPVAREQPGPVTDEAEQ